MSPLLEPVKLSDEGKRLLNERLANLEKTIAAVPLHVLQQARQHQQIDAHNAPIEAAKAKKRQLREIAKQARMPVRALKRMIGSVQKVK